MKGTARLTLCVGLMLLAASGCVRKGPRETNLVLAVVGEERITEEDFRGELGRLDPSLETQYRGDRMRLLNRMIDEEVIYQQAVAENLAGTPEAKRRLSWAEKDAAIDRLKNQEIYSSVTVTQKEIEKRYWEEATRPDGSEIVQSVLYIFEYSEDDVEKLLTAIQRGAERGLSFPAVARENSLPYETVEFGSPRFSDLPIWIQNIAVGMGHKALRAFSLGERRFYLFKDIKTLSSCFREVGRAVRNEKQAKALQEWLSSQRARATIRVHEEVLDDLRKTDAVAAEVNGLPVTVGDVAMLLERLSGENKGSELSDRKALLDKAIDREILRQEAWKRNLHNDQDVKKAVARETRRILVELLTEQNVTTHTPAAREKELAEWVEELKKATGVRVFAENVKRMHLPPSKEIRDVFGGETI